MTDTSTKTEKKPSVAHLLSKIEDLEKVIASISEQLDKLTEAKAVEPLPTRVVDLAIQVALIKHLRSFGKNVFPDLDAIRGHVLSAEQTRKSNELKSLMIQAQGQI